jgi:hypothetical protein
LADEGAEMALDDVVDPVEGADVAGVPELPELAAAVVVVVGGAFTENCVPVTTVT